MNSKFKKYLAWVAWTYAFAGGLIGHIGGFFVIFYLSGIPIYNAEKDFSWLLLLLFYPLTLVTWVHVIEWIEEYKRDIK